MALQFLSRWRPRHLAGAWVAYWLALAATTLGRAFGAAWKVTHLPGGEGSITASVTDGVLTLAMTESGRSVWQGSTSLTALAVWIAGPPLLLWAAWLVAARRGGRGSSPERAIATSAPPARPEPGLLDRPGPMADDLLRRERERRERAVRAEVRDDGRSMEDDRAR